MKKKQINKQTKTSRELKNFKQNCGIPSIRRRNYFVQEINEDRLRTSLKRHSLEKGFLFLFKTTRKFSI